MIDLAEQRVHLGLVALRLGEPAAAVGAFGQMPANRQLVGSGQLAVQQPLDPFIVNVHREFPHTSRGTRVSRALTAPPHSPRSTRASERYRGSYSPRRAATA